MWINKCTHVILFKGVNKYMKSISNEQVIFRSQDSYDSLGLN
jgi:hypothetical protein